MALNSKYVVSSDLESLFRDKDTGQPLAFGTIEFYKDNARNVPKSVYQLTGSPPNYSYVELPNPLTLSAIGTVQNANGDNEIIYWYPYDINDNQELYYVVVKDQGGTEQFTREAWPNPEGAAAPITTTSNENENQIANPTFTNVFINEGVSTTFTVSGATNEVFSVAPDWDFVISGTGTVEVIRTAIAGSDNVPVSPPYVLDVTVSAGVTSCLLRQRMNINSGLWASYGTTSIYLNGGFVAKNSGVSVANVEMIYEPSTGGSPVSIFTANVGFLYDYYSGTSSAITASSDTNLGTAGYVDIYLSLPEDSHIVLSAVNLFPSLNVPTAILPPLDSSNRNEAFQGDYYIPRLNAKTQNSFLVGWDFPMNPFQVFTSPAPTTISTTAKYIADQTIAKCFSDTLNFSQTVTRKELNVGWSIGTPQSFYLAQYISGNNAKDLIGHRLSVNIYGRVAAQAAIAYSSTMRVYLLQTSNASFPTLPVELGTLNADGTLTGFTAGWSEVDRSSLGTPQTVVSGTGTTTQIFEKGFSGWQITDTSKVNFAIVVTFTVSNGITMNLNSISLTPGDLPCRPGFLTQADTLLQCQFYYRKSFLASTPPAVNAGVGTGEYLFAQSTASGASKIGTYVNFPVRMRTTPNVTLYNPTNAISTASIRNITNNLNWLNTSATQISVNGFIAQGDAPGGSDFGELNGFHYTADARLGIV